MKENDVILIVDPDTPRGMWSFRRVVEIFCGKNEWVIVANVQIGNARLNEIVSTGIQLDKYCSVDKKKRHQGEDSRNIYL